MVHATYPEKLGEYEIIAPINAGGMGEVLLGRRRGAHNFTRLVAIKTIRDDFRDSRSLRQMFLAEARLTSRISHPAVAHVYDFGEEAGSLYLVMEYVSGVSFVDLVAASPPARVVAQLMASVSRGLHAAHEVRNKDGELCGVVHRDISPSNLMLTFDGAPKIIDFGIAFSDDIPRPKTQVGVLKGKPVYMSPEQLRGAAVDRRSDVWAAGVVLYELLTGHRPFPGPDVFELVQQITKHDFSPPGTIGVEGSSAFDAVIERCLTIDADDRYQNARDLAEELERVAVTLQGPDAMSYARDTFENARQAAAGRLQEITTLTPLSQVERDDGVTAEAGPEARATGVKTAVFDGSHPSSTELGRTTKIVDGEDDDDLRIQTAIAADTFKLQSSRKGRGARIAFVLGIVGAVATTAAVLGLSLENRSQDPAAARTESGGEGQRFQPVVVASSDSPPTISREEDVGAANLDAGAHAETAIPDADSDIEPPPKSTEAAAVLEPADGSTRVRKRSRRPSSRSRGRESASATARIDAAPPQTESGTLQVVSRIDAEIHVDGKLVGTGNIRISLTAGRHEVVAKHPLTKAILLSQEVNVAGGRPTRVKVVRTE